MYEVLTSTSSSSFQFIKAPFNSMRLNLELILAKYFNDKSPIERSFQASTGQDLAVYTFVAGMLDLVEEDSEPQWVIYAFFSSAGYQDYLAYVMISDGIWEKTPVTIRSQHCAQLSCYVWAKIPPTA